MNIAGLLPALFLFACTAADDSQIEVHKHVFSDVDYSVQLTGDQEIALSARGEDYIHYELIEGNEKLADIRFEYNPDFDDQLVDEDGRIFSLKDTSKVFLIFSVGQVICVERSDNRSLAECLVMTKDFFDDFFESNVSGSTREFLYIHIVFPRSRTDRVTRVIQSIRRVD